MNIGFFVRQVSLATSKLKEIHPTLVGLDFDNGIIFLNFSDGDPMEESEFVRGTPTRRILEDLAKALD